MAGKGSAEPWDTGEGTVLFERTSTPRRYLEGLGLSPPELGIAESRVSESRSVSILPA
ncbi:hypothetical protein DICSQDRAFT_137048 [Dichomitus squalens LYAD-421 SS1]|uniref:Uncharacterized protein n=1 Tax=Dichomitus squalens (strain LYAD-421) TaxID=732165 RepID=R7SXI2_DICSQ|nr:uncharacterized protein DICSQDRAFT_137048 [Dichomitus squalens LYAD-421 SS1]EJF60801.1 hypothetical protein DICSQDRAFT_137048 [Dichomitus squalens LYAD-421 SS1]